MNLAQPCWGLGLKCASRVSNPKADKLALLVGFYLSGDILFF